MRSALCGGLCFAVAAIGLAACGSDDDELTKAEFLKQGNAICRDGNKEIDAAADKAFSSDQRPSNAELEKFAEDTLIPSVEGQIDDLRDLTPPSADEDQVNAILDEADTALDETKADPAIVASNQDPFKKANQLAESYGLTECAG
jgi:hypothetical protein